MSMTEKEFGLFGLGVVVALTLALILVSGNWQRNSAVCPFMLDRVEVIDVLDDWTAWGIDEDGNRIEMADSPRYKQMGNAVTVNVIEWIGRRLNP
jgi:hypothetical protein